MTLLIQMPHDPQGFPFADELRRIVDLSVSARGRLEAYSLQYFLIQGMINALVDETFSQDLDEDSVEKVLRNLHSELEKLLLAIRQDGMLLVEYHKLLSNEIVGK